MLFSERIHSIGEVMSGEAGEIAFIFDIASGITGVYWSSADGLVLKDGQFRHGYILGGSEYELTKEEAVQFKAHITRRIG